MTDYGTGIFTSSCLRISITSAHGTPPFPPIDACISVTQEQLKIRGKAKWGVRIECLLNNPTSISARPPPSG